MDYDYLYNEYVVNKKSTTDISEECDYSCSTIRLRLKGYGLLRARKEALILSKPKMIRKRRARGGITFSETAKKNMSNAAKKRWKGNTKGYSLKPNGYYEVTIGENKGRSLHVVIMENHIGRKIKKNEVVHHDNKIKTDNRIENLKVMTRSEHARHHAKQNYSKKNINNKGQFKK